MNFASVEKIARAMLYEGYILYPYRATSTKNQQRWNSGTLYPRDWAESQRPAESSRMITECLLRAEENPQLNIRASFLQLIPSTEDWNQGIERSSDHAELDIVKLCQEPISLRLNFNEPQGGPGLGALSGNVSVHVLTIEERVYKLHFELVNTTVILNPESLPRKQALLHSMLSAHLLLGVQNGRFISLLDPPHALRQAAQGCQNVGAFPVLAGEEGDCSMMLASPIILYDYPRIAPESTGDFFDGTEMDEMLALRVMTLTAEEKELMRHGDEQARQILHRTETLPPEHWMKIHGAIRGMRPVTEAGQSGQNALGDWDPLAEKPVPQSVNVFGIELRKGSRVRLWPQKSADIIDMALQGKVAVIEAIEQDFEDHVHLAVVIEDDPGRDMGMMRQPGHRFFFSPDEVEPMDISA